MQMMLGMPLTESISKIFKPNFDSITGIMPNIVARLGALGGQKLEHGDL